ncbi:MAG: glycogen-binding domain-containing protein [Longimicrobiaceae bacterium]
MPAPSQAQEGWTAGVSAGGVSYQTGSAPVGVRNLILGLGYAGNRSGLYLAGGIPVEEVGVAWGVGGGWLRLRPEGLPWLALDAGGHLFGYRDPLLEEPGGGITFDLLPGLLLARGLFEAGVRSGVIYHAARGGGDRLSRALHHSDLRVVYEPVSGLRLGAEGRYLRGEGVKAPYAGAKGELERGRVAVRASAGRWLAESLDGWEAHIDASLRLAGRLDLLAAWRLEPTSPVYLNHPRESWTVGFSFRLGPNPGARLAVEPVVSERGVTFRVPVRRSGAAPAVVGDFSGWEPLAMRRRGQFWELVLEVAPGVYHYGFQTASGEWFVPEGVATVDDGFGGESALLVVP